jgi:hypothetical protein
VYKWHLHSSEAVSLCWCLQDFSGVPSVPRMGKPKRWWWAMNYTVQRPTHWVAPSFVRTTVKYAMPQVTLHTLAHTAHASSWCKEACILPSLPSSPREGKPVVRSEMLKPSRSHQSWGFRQGCFFTHQLPTLLLLCTGFHISEELNLNLPFVWNHW